MAHLRQPTIQRVLHLNASWLEPADWVPTDKQLRWIYGLLVALDPLLDAEATALLRRLARHCARHRSTQPRDSSLYAALTVPIVLVSLAFGQTDLALPDTGAAPPCDA